jgi:two-component system KDP operon response regulator KdpE
MDNRPLVLIADDQPEFARLVALSLGREGFLVETVNDGLAALDKVSELNPDLLLLDLTMPGMSGIEVLAELSDTHPIPVIVLASEAAASAVARGLDHGADDFVAKPFHPAELAARIRAVLRRRRRMVGGHRQVGAATVDLDRRQITIDGRPVRIGRVEWVLLEHLLTNPGRILMHEELLTRVWGPAYRDDVPYLRLWVGQLRRRLGIPAWEEGPIRTIQGMGYAYDPDASIPTMRSRRPRSPGRQDAVASASRATTDGTATKPKRPAAAARRPRTGTPAS